MTGDDIRRLRASYGAELRALSHEHAYVDGWFRRDLAEFYPSRRFDGRWPEHDPCCWVWRYDALPLYLEN